MTRDDLYRAAREYANLVESYGVTGLRVSHARDDLIKAAKQEIERESTEEGVTRV